MCADVCELHRRCSADVCELHRRCGADVCELHRRCSRASQKAHRAEHSIGDKGLQVLHTGQLARQGAAIRVKSITAFFMFNQWMLVCYCTHLLCLCLVRAPALGVHGGQHLLQVTQQRLNTCTTTTTMQQVDQPPCKDSSTPPTPCGSARPQSQCSSSTTSTTTIQCNTCTTTTMRQLDAWLPVSFRQMMAITSC